MDRAYQLKILVVDEDALLHAEIEGLSHPAVEFSVLSRHAASASTGPIRERDVIVVGVDTQGSLDLIADLCARPGMPPVIALAGRGSHGKSLEHVLTLAELRGAALSLPKPLDAIELALAAIELVARRRPTGPDMSIVAKDLESRLAW